MGGPAAIPQGLVFNNPTQPVKLENDKLLSRAWDYLVDSEPIRFTQKVNMAGVDFEKTYTVRLQTIPVEGQENVLISVDFPKDPEPHDMIKATITDGSSKPVICYVAYPGPKGPFKLYQRSTTDGLPKNGGFSILVDGRKENYEYRGDIDPKEMKEAKSPLQKRANEVNKHCPPIETQQILTRPVENGALGVLPEGVMYFTEFARKNGYNDGESLDLEDLTKSLIETTSGLGTEDDKARGLIIKYAKYLYENGINPRAYLGLDISLEVLTGN